MQFNRSKLRAIILRASHQCESSKLGATKLHKILYYVDMLHFAATGASVTGAAYRKRPHGPTCDQLPSTLNQMIDSNEISVQEVDYFGYLKKQYETKIDPKNTVLSAIELALTDEVIEFVCNRNSAKTISELSHNRAWEMANFGDVLPYVSAFYIFPSEVSSEAFEWAANEARRIEDPESEYNSVDFVDFRTFRSRLESNLEQSKSS